MSNNEAFVRQPHEPRNRNNPFTTDTRNAPARLHAEGWLRAGADARSAARSFTQPRTACLPCARDVISTTTCTTIPTPVRRMSLTQKRR